MRWKVSVFVAVFLAVSLSLVNVALACKGGQVLYEDNFSALDPGWGAPSANLSAGNGKLTLAPDVNFGLVALNQANVFGDMDVCAKMNIAKTDDPTWAGGLLFWAKDYDNYYALFVTGDGQFSVRRYVDGSSSPVVDWSSNAAIRQGVGAWNHLRVVTNGNQGTAYVNDTQVGTFQGESPQGGGFIGFKGSSSATSQIIWEFSELKVTSVTASAPTTVTPPAPVTQGDSDCKGQVVYEDDFSTMDPAWGQPDDKASVRDGKFILQPDINTSWTVINQANVFEDMDFCINVSLAKSDDPNYGGGVVFWAKDYTDYYYLMVTGDGWFTVKRWVNSRVLDPVAWREVSALRQGLGQWNQIRLSIRGTQATAYVNGTEVISFKGQPSQAGSFIGMTGNTPAEAQNKNIWEFDNLKVTKP